MRKFFVAFVVLVLTLGAAFSADNTKKTESAQSDSKKQDAQLEPLMAPGDLAVTAGLGYGFLWGAIDVTGGAEYIIGQFKIGDTLPLSYGAAVKASYYRWDEYFGTEDWHYSYFGGGVFGTLHLGLKDLGLAENMRWLADVDTYVGLGLGLYGYTYPTWNEAYTEILSKTEMKVGVRAAAGVSYFITPNIAIVTEGGYYGFYGSGLIGVLLKF
jgi:opacity protein-like surface antigen